MKTFFNLHLFPKLNSKQFFTEIISGIIVGIVALPLAIAFGIASGVTPEKGLITAIIGGFIVSLIGGSKVQIGGPTGAFIVIVYGIVQQYGINGLIVATLMAGVILIIMGVARFGVMIKFIPYPVVVGFTSGIAVVIFSSQIKDFLGLQINNVPADFIEKWTVYFQNIASINYHTIFIALLSLVIIVFWPKVSRKIPGSLLAIFISAAIVSFFNLNVETIESKFGEIPSVVPQPIVPMLNFEIIRNLIMPATTIAILAAIEALLSAVVADGMIGSRHNSNKEMIAQGFANILSPIFGGIPVTGAIARTATNIKNGGRTPLAGIIHSISLLLIMIFLGKWAKLIPMATLAAILVVVSYNMSEYKVFYNLLKSPKSDVAVLLTTFFLTVILDLTVAIEVGMILAVFLFMRRMAEVSNLEIVKKETSGEEKLFDKNSIQNKVVPDEVEIYEINGPFFFGAANKFREVMSEIENPPKIRIIRMRNVPAIDATGLNLLGELIKDSIKIGVKIILSGVNSQPRNAMKIYGILNIIGEENVFDNIDDALERAKIILEE
ncbi:MAG: sulfate permease [Ignavibacteriales bacterium]|nr:sulfate permease [Ignavibacteriales bacterium]